VPRATKDQLAKSARALIDELAEFERPSASDAERRAGVLIAAQLEAEGCTAAIECEQAHGTYWWPLGLLTFASGVAALFRSRLIRIIAGAFTATALADDISGGTQWFRRAALPQRATWNVVAETGDPTARETIVFVAHHDAANWSLLFAPQIPEFFGERFPGQLERSHTTPPIMFPVFAGPVLTLLSGLTGSNLLRRAAAVLSLGSAITFAEIGSRSVVPGANDNLSGVAVLTGLARLLRDEPAPGLRVLLVSTGSEESFMEGMRGFAKRHFEELPVATTRFVCVDSVGSPTLMQLEGEGMLRMADYDNEFKAQLSEAAAEIDVELVRGLRFRNATDALISLHAGYRTLMLGSISRYKAPSNYHWPTDTPENVDYSSVVDATLLCERLVRKLASDQPR
jgi:Peptidase family M28